MPQSWPSLAMILILMGVSGSGKTRIGQQLADDLGWMFFDGDAYHPPANIQKMEKGLPLDDADREPWLSALADLLSGLLRSGQPAILAASLLKETYRRRLSASVGDIRLIYLRGDYATIHARLAQRPAHFMPPSLLFSQFAVLEEPDDAVVIDIRQPPEAIIRQIRGELHI